MVGTAIQSIWRSEAPETAGRYAELEATHPGRFLLGLGVSHPQSTPGYRRPYAAMTAYLDALDDPAAGATVAAGRRLTAALGPGMLGLARDRTAGALPYLVTAEQAARAREVLGGPVYGTSAVGGAVPTASCHVVPAATDCRQARITLGGIPIPRAPTRRSPVR